MKLIKWMMAAVAAMAFQVMPAQVDTPAATEDPQLTPAQAQAKFDQFIGIVTSRYMDDVNAGQLVDDAIVKVLSELDPHSLYFTPEELKETNEQLEGNFEGIGIQFNILQDTIIVVNVISGGPSEKVGLMAGDKIVQINEENVAGSGITNKGVTDRLRGKKGTEVTVYIERKNAKKKLEFRITRDVIPLYSIDAKYMASPETGYIRLGKFSATTADEFNDAITELKSQGMKNLILDLRGNGGGYLNAAIRVANEFLPQNKLVVYWEGRAYPRQNAYSDGRGKVQDGRVVVLIDESSASASEIVSGALQDWDRALIIGRRSFGKGLVQQSYELPDGSAFRLTTSRYYTPSGRCIQKPYDEGVEAYRSELNERFYDGEMFNDTSYQLPDSLKFFTNNKRVVYGGGGIMPDVFIPLDTSWATDYYYQVVGKGIVNQFALTYVNQNRENLNKKYTDVYDFNAQFAIDDKIWSDFFEYAASDSVAKNEEQFEQSKIKLANTLKAVIARDLYSFEAFWIVVNSEDAAYLKALQSIKDDTFTKMKIAVR